MIYMDVTILFCFLVIMTFDHKSKFIPTVWWFWFRKDDK